ncbi:MAG: TIGR04255 family protein [Verrucomicrobia bacterium]|nr:MAG: TIGR04255 family protein [Verrucomicrobiota bacterium]
MGERLKNPPLVEAVSVLGFHSEDSWDWTVPGRLYDQVKSDYPAREELRAVRLPVAPSGSIAAGQEQVVERLRFKKTDGTAMVQCGPRLLVVNHLPPYPGWEAFKTRIMAAFSAYEKVVGECRVVRVELRYINRMPTTPGESPGAKLVLFPELPTPLAKPVASFFQHYELRYEETSSPGTLVHRSGTVADPGGSSLMLDLAHVVEIHDGLSDRDRLEGWLDTAHDRVHEAFVASIPKELYRALKEGNP